MRVEFKIDALVDASTLPRAVKRTLEPSAPCDRHSRPTMRYGFRTHGFARYAANRVLASARSSATPEGQFDYYRSVQPLLRIGPFQDRLDTLLTENEARHRRDRLRMTRIHDLLRREGFEGSYDAVRCYARRWAEARRKDHGDDIPAFIPLLFRPGEAYQFDWSHEDVEIAGKPMRVKVAHMRLRASRAVNVRAYRAAPQSSPCDWRSSISDGALRSHHAKSHGLASSPCQSLDRPEMSGGEADTPAPCQPWCPQGRYRQRTARGERGCDRTSMPRIRHCVRPA